MDIYNVTTFSILLGSNAHQLLADCEIIVQDGDDSSSFIIDGTRGRNSDPGIIIGSGQPKTRTNKIVGAADDTSSHSSESNLKELHREVKKLPLIKRHDSTRSEV